MLHFDSLPKPIHAKTSRAENNLTAQNYSLLSHSEIFNENQLFTCCRFFCLFVCFFLRACFCIVFEEAFSIFSNLWSIIYWSIQKIHTKLLIIVLCLFSFFSRCIYCFTLSIINISIWLACSVCLVVNCLSLLSMYKLPPHTPRSKLENPK